MLLLKKIAVWAVYLAVCTAALMLFKLGPIPTVVLYMAGYFVALAITGKMGKTKADPETTEEE